MERPSGDWTLGRVRAQRGDAAEPTPLHPHEPLAGRPRLSVIVPAYGEGRRIAATVTTLRQSLARSGDPGELEVVVVDDGSLDDTAEQAGRAGADQVIRLPANRGKGAAVRLGMLAATGSAVVFTDADLSYSPAQVMRVRDEIERGWDAVVGSRVHPEANPLVPAGPVRRLSGRVDSKASTTTSPRSSSGWPASTGLPSTWRSSGCASASTCPSWRFRWSWPAGRGPRYGCRPRP